MNDDTCAYLGIMRLQRAYADISTRRAWAEVPSLATPDAQFVFDTRSGQVFEVNGTAAYAEFGAKMTEAFSFYEYIPVNFVVSIDPEGTAQGRTFSLEVAEERETGDWLDFYGLYQDSYMLLEGNWRFTRRHYRTLGRRRAGQLQAFSLEDSGL
jgi:SnoaL-like domain